MNHIQYVRGSAEIVDIWKVPDVLVLQLKPALRQRKGDTAVAPTGERLGL
jgi:hypothetical protein